VLSTKLFAHSAPPATATEARSSPGTGQVLTRSLQFSNQRAPSYTGPWVLGLAVAAAGIMAALWTAVGWRTAFVPALFPPAPVAAHKVDVGL